SNVPIYPVINETVTAFAKSLIIEEGASLTLEGSLQLSESLSGTLDAKSGTLILAGTASQNIPAGAFSDNQIKDLYINNPAGVSLHGETRVSGVLRTLQGILHSNGNLVLLSDQDRTALISGVGTGSISGTIHLQRFINPAYGYKYLSFPLLGSKVADLEAFFPLKDAVTGFPHFYRYVEAREDENANDLTGWEAYIDPSKPLNILEGYAANFGTSDSAITFSLSGEPVNGPQHRVFHNTNGQYTRGFHLLGNPYPSPIDWNKAEGWNRQNIDDAIHFFEAADSDPYTG